MFNKKKKLTFSHLFFFLFSLVQDKTLFFTNAEFVFRSKQIENYWQFLAAINWFEPWLIALGGFHAVCLLIIILTRGHLNVQILIFLALLSAVYASEYLNEIAARKWELFAEDQYFDSQGMFISTVFCLPIIVNCCVLVVLWLIESVVLLKVLVKRFRQKRSVNSKNKND